ncbi:MAG: 1-hydroxycarotenoid 3,4-desaturase CrtD, partial [Pseudomonadota bacterium]
MRKLCEITVVGAGIGGLAAAIRLAAVGHNVTVLEIADGPGGKIRTRPSPAGPIDIGPTVFTMRWVFEDLFRTARTALQDHLTLAADPILARHWWPDGSSLDLFADPAQSAQAVGAFAGAKAEQQFRAFSNHTRRLFETFQNPMMETGHPNSLDLAKAALSAPQTLLDLIPGKTLARALRQSFDDPRLQQLFGRYATYVGGSPFASPALLSLIAHSEALGVWSVQGGMYKLAVALEQVAKSLGVTFRYRCNVQQVSVDDGHATGVLTADGYQPADCVVFNGDPSALTQGILGKSCRPAVASSQVHPRSLSAWVWGFSAKPNGPDLSHHNVFFGSDPKQEFGPIAQGDMPADPTLYICAQDRAAGSASKPDQERFEIIMNGAPTQDSHPRPEDQAQCQIRVFQTLAQFGLTFDPAPTLRMLTTPA